MAKENKEGTAREVSGQKECTVAWKAREERVSRGKETSKLIPVLR